MGKITWKPSTMLNPVPAVMVSCAGKDGKPNIITLAWVGTINSEPPMLSISVRKERHSFGLIKESGEFIVNLGTKKLAYALDYCGVKTGRDIDKFAGTNLTPQKASKVSAPAIAESPVNIECIVRDRVELGSHVMFLGEIVAVDIDEGLVDKEGKLHLEQADLICFSHGMYYGVDGKSLGSLGFSVKGTGKRQKSGK